MPKCRHEMEAAWCGDCKAAKARRRGTAASQRSKKRAGAGSGSSDSVSRTAAVSKKRGATKAVGSEAQAQAQGALPSRARRITAKKVPRAGEVTVRKVPGPRPPGPQATASQSTSTRPPAVSPAAEKMVQRRRRGLADAEKVLAKAQRSGTGVTAARQRFDIARQRLREAERIAGPVKTSWGPELDGSAHGPLRVDPLEALTDRGGEAAPPHLDPDLREGLVWVLRRGSAYHRRDCHVIEARQGGVALTRSKAQSLGFARCEVCSPLA